MSDGPFLWGGRFEAAPSADLQAFGASLPVDRRLWQEDITGSIAHARMLAAISVISAEDCQAIIGGLERIADSLRAGSFVFLDSDEDIHTAIERVLVADIGEAGKRLHTGRSRNDQVATDSRLYFKRRTGELIDHTIKLRQVLLGLAEAHIDVILPGYTHLQPAQPVLFSHHMLAYYWMFTRDSRRLAAAREAANASPLGAAALAGSGYALDRSQTADELGFTDASGGPALIPNSMDAVSDRDFMLDAVYAAAVTMMHLSRLCEELVLWSSAGFGFITLSDAFSTGSSIMPQKKNPDFAELVRGKTGRVYGDLMALLTVLKGLPLAYNKDMQEDKESSFDALDTCADCLVVMSGMLSTLTVNADCMLDAASGGFMSATDLADWLVQAGLAFREAHELVGRLVLLAERSGRRLDELSLDELREISPLFDEHSLAVLEIRSVVERKTSFGGTATARVLEQLELAKASLAGEL